MSISAKEFLKGGEAKLVVPASENYGIKKPNFLERVGTSLKERGGEIMKTFGETAEGRITPVESAVRVVGDVAGVATDGIGAVI